MFEKLRQNWTQSPAWHRVLFIFSLFAAAGGFYLTAPFLWSHIREQYGPFFDNPALFILVGVAIFWAYLIDANKKRQQRQIQERIERAERELDEHPEKSRPLWDIARNRLELYFERNLQQIRSIYWIMVVVMLAGFAMIGYGIFKAFDDQAITAALLTTASGIITEFIGATFLVIYKSTLNQANDYVRTLAAINAVGMSMQILDSMPEGEDNLKSKSKAQVAAKILESFTGSPGKKA